ncbi:tRNA (guanine(26)-N(2))-dimethyltransferase [Strongyloides ratti]|uniref:tRNA (guanine(26)-N(2))-dimethyltransferase n=1 Tax=Strongyloides ratti TaxID=34506 RepID=A0A090L0K3_STRRB|nr:tRNA (guanine(26)-N(2))-dimethyltransferase [Strongyloides ratti]CEF61029.1 tRNA (guanine(26)-N(2))-dimethyltransferase [Strongyloides ratti]
MSSMKNEIVEGKARLYFDGDKEAFYNPVQEFNRDLTITVLRQFVADRENKKLDEKEETPPIKKSKKFTSNGITILDALSASGLRALRFAQEVPNVDKIIANDFSENAVEIIKKNIELNNVENIVIPNYGDAVDCMMKNRSVSKRFTAIDLDPYGSASIFIDSAVQSVADDGILMVTCTDMAVLCGNTPETCYIKYNSIPLKHKSCHEMALRILLRCIDSHANKYGRYIVPLLSASIDFYIRVFVRVKSSQKEAKTSVRKLGNVLTCSGCHSFHFQQIIKHTKTEKGERYQAPQMNTLYINDNGKCINCDSTFHLGGPIYLDPIHDMDFVRRLLKQLKELPNEQQLGTHRRLEGFLSLISEELIDVPLYYDHDQLMNILKCAAPKHTVIKSAILNAGYRVSQVHTSPTALKTDCPQNILWDIVRSIAFKNNICVDKFSDEHPGKKIISKKIEHSVNFDLHPMAVSVSKKLDLLRFQCNKGKNWGPKQKAKGSVNNIRAGFIKEV